MPLLVAEFDGLCMQFEEKQLYTLVAQYGPQTLHQTRKGCLITPSSPSSLTEFKEVSTYSRKNSYKTYETCLRFRLVGQSRKKIAIHFATLGGIYIGHSSTRHVHNLMKRQLYTYLSSEGRLVMPLLVAEFDGLCMQFEEKQLYTLVAQYGPQTLHQTRKGCLITPSSPSSLTEFKEVSTYSRKNSYKTYETCLRRFCTQFQEKPATVFIRIDAEPRLVAALELTPRLTVSEGKQQPPSNRRHI